MLPKPRPPQLRPLSAAIAGTSATNSLLPSQDDERQTVAGRADRPRAILAGQCLSYYCAANRRKVFSPSPQTQEERAKNQNLCIF
ncbi:hypothetical protein BST61_g7588 [Cercospora zeina]